METDSKKVLCVGLCCLDIVMVCESYPKEDSDQRCLSHQWQRGGNASNNATIFAEFEVPCEILGTMSTDIGGQFMKNDFSLHNISCENCHFYDDFESPTSVVWINSQNGSRTIVHSNKDMPEITFEDFKVLNLENYSWIHFECRPNYENIKTIIEHIRTWNSNEANNQIRISIEIEKPKTESLEMLGLGDVVFISKDFAVACGYSDMTSAVEVLCHELRPGGVLICAWGDNGACAKTYDGPVHISKAYQPSQIVYTLGAGDTFVAATIISLMKGEKLCDAIHIGCKVAGTKCSMHDTQGLADLCPYLL